MAHPMEPLRMLATLRAHGVSFVLVGGVASAAHGGPIAFDDVDICIPQDTDNLRKISLALQQLGAEPIGEDSAHRSSYATTAGRLDVIELGSSFAGLYERGSDEDLGGVVARVASMVDLMELNRRSGDLANAAHLAAIAGPAVEDVDEFGPANDDRDWPAWLQRLWTAFEDIDAFLTRKIYGDGSQIRS
jgi:hypothetical protein